ncbi:MAG: glycoside hydrolase, partial [Actinobacteria bacterium]|nr:glycoside hydrolase [Actinomycetota bacterium]
MNNSNVFHGPIAFGRNGTLYYALSGWDVEDREVSKLSPPPSAVSNRLGNFSVLLGRSTNLGDSWQTTLVRNARGTQGEVIEDNRPVMGVAVDTRSGSDDTVYVTFQTSYPATVAPNLLPNLPRVAVSRDGGRTFGAPVNLAADAYQASEVRAEGLRVAPSVTTIPPANVSTTTTTAPAQGSRAAEPNRLENWGGRNPHMTVDGEGNAYVIWHSSTANITPTPPPAYFLSKSTDKGKTWQTTQIGPFDLKNGPGSRITWGAEGGDLGTLHWVHQGADDPDVGAYSTVYYRQSTDGGKTWSPRRALPDDADPKFERGKYIPNISVAPNGRIDATWWDTRDDPGTRSNDVYYTYSEDNGKTWAKNLRVTDQSINRQYGVWGVNFDQSSPVGLASANAHAVFSWDDTRNTDLSVGDSSAIGGGTSDIFFANAQFEAVGGGVSTTAKVI